MINYIKNIRPITWIIIILAVFLVSIFAVRFSTDEDSWVCNDGKWTEHGNPASNMPTTGCGDETNEQINFSKYGYISDRETDQPNTGMYLVYEEPGKPALSAKLEFDEKSNCEFSGKISPCISLNSTIEKDTENIRVLISGIEKNRIVQVIKLATDN